jgi:hypothetical protein
MKTTGVKKLLQIVKKNIYGRMVHIHNVHENKYTINN